ncbi:MAG: endonuclease domain-containing protein [Cyclobacteriaceae bacterium]|nr:endonuclease domain-containing protein [Cyclobacteriaceae bacterium]
MDLPFHHNAKPKTFENARFLKKVETEAETWLWQHLRGRKLGGFKFRRQHPIHSYIVDFYCHECNLVVEVDGMIHKVNDNPGYDQGRTDDLVRLGLTVIRFTNNEVLTNIPEVLAEIRKHLKNKPR